MWSVCKMRVLLFLILIVIEVGIVTSFVNLSAVNAPIARISPLEMRHKHGFNKLNRPADQRKALLRGLTTELIRHGRIKTILARAKAMRKPVDHMITLAKRGTEHHRRQAYAYLYDRSLVDALFEQAPARYGTRNGGYCRVIRDPIPRRGDGSKMAVIELV